MVLVNSLQTLILFAPDCFAFCCRRKSINKYLVYLILHCCYCLLFLSFHQLGLVAPISFTFFVSQTSRFFFFPFLDMCSVLCVVSYNRILNRDMIRNKNWLFDFLLRGRQTDRETLMDNKKTRWG